MCWGKDQIRFMSLVKSYNDIKALRNYCLSKNTPEPPDRGRYCIANFLLVEEAWGPIIA